MRRVGLGTQIDDPPTRGLTKLIGQSLSRGPCQAIDHERDAGPKLKETGARIIGAKHLAQLSPGQVRPFRDDENAVRLGGAACRINNKRTSQLTKRHGRVHGRRPIMISAGAAALEAHLACLTGRHLYAWARRAVARAKSVYLERRIEIVTNRRRDRRSFRNTDQWSWHRQR